MTLIENLNATLKHLKKKKKILFLTTSSRWQGDEDIPKSTRIANALQKNLSNVKIIDVSKLKIHTCEGNVSRAAGNNCGVKDATLKDKNKNPTGNHRCWASINNPDDELWKISKELFSSDTILFFGSIRWGQMNSIYQKLIERLTWIENRHSTLGEKNTVKNIDAGIIITGHNWHGKEVLETQMSVLKYFGFKVQPQLCWNWQFTTPKDESNKSYKAAAKEFGSEIDSFK